MSTPVAGGEYLYGIVPFRHMVEHRSVDIVMIDQVRSGGITPWLKIAGMAEAFNLPVVSHGVPEIHVHLVGAVPNGLTVEYMPRLFHLWEAVPGAGRRRCSRCRPPPASASNSTRRRLRSTARSARLATRAVRIIVGRLDAKRYATVVERDDGVRLSVPGYGFMRPLPHDLAHYVVEFGPTAGPRILGQCRDGGEIAWDAADERTAEAACRSTIKGDRESQ